MYRHPFAAIGLRSIVLLTLTFAFAQSATPQKKNSEEFARGLIRTRLNSPGSKAASSDLRLGRNVESLIGSHFVFEQTYRGVPVEGGRTAVHLDKDGGILGMTDSFKEGINLETVLPAVDERSAIRAARFAIGGGASRYAATLVIHDHEGGYRLAWRVDLSTEGPTWQLYIDAHSGEQLGPPRDINRYVDGVGQIFRSNAIVATQNNSLIDARDSASAVPASAYTIATLRGLFGNGYLDGEFASSRNTRRRAFDLSNTFIFDRSSDGFSETMGYFYIDHAERYIQSLGIFDVNARQQVFAVNTFKGDNSFYSPSTKEISFGTGGVDDAEDAEIILHEYGHSIQDDQSPGFGTSLEAGAMGEGFGDYFAASVTAQFSNGFQDECVGEWDAVSYSNSVPPCLRRLDGTKHYPEDLVGQVHADGEIWSAALWQIRGAIGAEKADRAVIESHFLLSQSASFHDGANALITAARALGYRRREVAAIRDILTDRGFAPAV